MGDYDDDYPGTCDFDPQELTDADQITGRYEEILAKAYEALAELEAHMQEEMAGFPTQLMELEGELEYLRGESEKNPYLFCERIAELEVEIEELLSRMEEIENIYLEKISEYYDLTSYLESFLDAPYCY